MHLYGIRVSRRREMAAQAGQKLRATAALMLGLIAGTPSGFAQQEANPAPPQTHSASSLPSAPAPTPTEPLDLRQTQRDFSNPAHGLLDLPWKPYTATEIPAASFMNSVRLTDLVKNGKIYLSLSDAMALAIENNYDIAIARYNLDIADTDILRSKAGGVLRGVNSGVISNTLGNAGGTLTSGGGPGGTSGGAGGAAAGVGGLVTSTISAGPLPENRDPLLAGTIQLERAKLPQANLLFSGGKSALTTNTNCTTSAIARASSPVPRCRWVSITAGLPPITHSRTTART